MTVYVIAQEPWNVEEGYLTRFRGEVFANKVNAIEAMKDIVRKIEHKRVGYAHSKEIEFENNEARIIWRYTDSDGECTETTCLRVERLQVPNGRIEFVSGKASVENWENVLIKDPRFKGWTCQDWVRHFSDAASYSENGLYSIDELRKKCDWWKFVGVTSEQLDMDKLAASCPWFLDRPECSLLRPNPSQWALLIKYHPEFSVRCKSWDLFNGTDWAGLLCDQPQFADKCDWSKLDAHNWCSLLCSQPQFADKCDWSKLDAHNWCSLLCSQPQFAKHCKWSSLQGRDWCELLVKMPEFEEFLNRDQLRDGTLSMCCWMVPFLGKFPQYIDDCDLGELGDSWPYFLRIYPQYANQCDFSRFCADDWGALLPVYQQFIENVNWSIPWQKKYGEGCVLVELIEKLPDIISHCKWSELRGDVLVEILKHFPEAAAVCDWRRLTKADWYNLLLTHPKYGNRCTCWESFSGWQIGKLLSVNAKLAEMMNFNEFSEVKLTDILIMSPELRSVVDCRRIKDKINVMRLCAVHQEYCAVLSGGENWRNIKSYVWNGQSGPIVVIPVRTWTSKVPDYPVDVKDRANRYSVSWWGSVERGGGKSVVSSYEAELIVDKIFSARRSVKAFAIDGVYVETEHREDAGKFATIMKNWFANNETSIKILYLENGGYYPSSALEG
jgi:hypothetical protein